MQTQFDNNLINSFLLYLDHEILSRGQAFHNYSGSLYRISGRINGLNVYSTPFKQLVNDVSISGANVMTGLYVSGGLVYPGQSGLVSLNINDGTAFFSGAPTSVSGVYAIKDFGIYLTNKPEEAILFETKYEHKDKYNQTLTGLPQNSETYPAIYLKTSFSEDTPLCFGGIDNREVTIRAIVLGDSQFLTDAVCSIMKDLSREEFKIIDYNNLPFDSYGGFTGVNYNYTGLAAASSNKSLIWSVKHANLTSSQEYNKLNPQIYPAFVDFHLWSILG
jgi:hypothetical protein